MVLLLVPAGRRCCSPACARAVRRRRRAAEAARLDQLLRGAPALAMTVGRDGRVEMPRRLADWLGLREPARFLAELTGEDGGLSPADARAS